MQDSLECDEGRVVSLWHLHKGRSMHPALLILSTSFLLLDHVVDDVQYVYSKFNSGRDGAGTTSIYIDQIGPIMGLEIVYKCSYK